jgi:hypothetical protein
MQVRDPLPDARANAPVENEMILLPGPPVPGSVAEPVATKETFVTYLRRSFRWAGFPGYVTNGGPTRDRDLQRLRPLFGRMIGL